MRIEEKATVQIGVQPIPLRIIKEQRPSTRISLNRNGAILRIPILSTRAEVAKHMDWAQQWLLATFQKKPQLFSLFEARSYQNGDMLQVGNRTYLLIVSYSNRKQLVARQHEGAIAIDIPFGIEKEQEKQHLSKLLAKVAANDFLPEITQRVYELNDRYFQQPIHSVCISTSQSRWGSCSSKQVISLSANLLFAPQEVIDYVIIHELAHLVEFNHSDRFWRLVEQADPQYKQHEKWLKVHGATCRY